MAERYSLLENQNAANQGTFVPAPAPAPAPASAPAGRSLVGVQGAEGRIAPPEQLNRPPSFRKRVGRAIGRIRSLTPSRRSGRPPVAAPAGRSLVGIEGPQGYVATGRAEQLENNAPSTPESNTPSAPPVNYRRALRRIAGPRRTPSAPAVRQVRPLGEEGYVAKGPGYARLNGPAKPNPSLGERSKQTLRGIKETLAIQRKSIPRSFAVAQEVIVLGERVHFQEATTLYSVNFKEKYFLQNAGEDETEYISTLGTAEGTFSAYFSGAMPNQMPLKPCNEEEYAVLKRGLETRFSTLREEVKELQAESGDSVAVREGVEHLLRIKAWLEGMEANEGCFALDKGATQGVGAEGPRDIDDEQVAQLLRSFAFLVLQAQGAVPEFESNQGGVDAGEIVDMVGKVKLDDTAVKNYTLAKPGSSHKLLELLTGARPEVLEALVDETLADELLGLLRSRVGAGAVAAQAGGGYQQKVAELKQLITALLKELDRAEQRVKQAEAMLPTKDQQLTKLAADLAAAEARIAAHGATKSESEVKIGELAGKLAAAQGQLTAARTAEEAAKREVAAAASGINKSVEEAQAEIAALKAAQERVNQERDTAKAEAADATTARDELAAQIEGLQTTIAGHFAETTELGNKLKAKEEEVADLLKEKETLTEQLAAASGNTAALETKKQELEHSHAEALRAKEDELSSQIANMQGAHATALSEKAAEMAEIAAQREALAKEKAEFAAQLAAAEKAKGEVELAKGNLTTELAEQQKRTSTAAALAARHSAQLRELTEQKEAADAQLASLQDVKDKLATAIAANKADQDRIADLQEKLDRVTAAEQILLEQQKVANASIAALTSSLREAEAAKSTAEKESADLKTTIARLEEEGKAAQRDIEELTKQLSQAQERELELRGQVTSLEAERVKMLGTIEKVKEDKQKAIDGLRAAKAKELAEQKEALEAQHKTAEEALQKEIEDAKAAAATQKAELESRIRDVETELRKSQNAYELLEAVLEKTKAEHAKALEDKEAIIRRMQEDNSALQTKLAEGEAEAKRMRGEIVEKQLRIQQVQGELRAAEEKIAAAGEEIAELRELRSTLMAKIAGLEDDVVRLGGEVLAKETSLKELGETLDKSKEEMNGLNQTLEKERASFTAQSQAFESQRSSFEERLREAGERERAQAAAATEQQRSAAAAAQQAAATAAEQAAAIAAAEQAAEGLQQRATVAERDKATALQRAETAEAAESGLFTTVLSLATRISQGQTVDDIIAGNERFREIYNRMDGLVKAATKPGPGPQPAPKPSGDQKQRSCYLNYFISFFLRQFFFSGSNLPEKQATYASVKTMVDEFLSEHSDMELTSVITDIFNLLRVAETPGNPNLQTQFSSAFKTFFRQRVGSNALTTSLKEYFMEGFKGFQAVAAREPISGITYPVLLAVYIATAQKFLVLRQSELAAYCPVPRFLLKPSESKPAKQRVIRKTRDALVPVEAAEAVEETEGPPTDKDYARLGLRCGAKLEAVRKAYLRKALQTHPNKGGDPAEFKRMKTSYERIKAYLERAPAGAEAEAETPVIAVEDAPSAPEPEPAALEPEPAALEPEPAAPEPPALEPEPVPLDPTPENYQRLGVTEATTADGIKRSYANKSRPNYSLRPDDPTYNAKLKRSYDRLMARRRSLPGTPKKGKPTVNKTRKVEPTSTTRAQLRASWNALATAQAAAKQTKQ